VLVPETEAKQEKEPEVIRISDIGCKKRLGGVLKHCYRKAA
jgi:hypothetical protein